MKIVIVGSPQAGQQQLFSLLTGSSLDLIMQKPLEVQQGISEVKDPRVTKLIQLYKPKKFAYARIEYLLLPDFNLKGPSRDLIFGQLKNADEICWVAKSDSAQSDVSNFISELIISDTLLVEKRLETIAKDQRKKYSEVREKEKELMDLCAKQLESEQPISKMQLSDDLKKLVRTYQFFTMKPLFIVINVPEDKIKDSSLLESLQKSIGYPCVQLSAEIESEIGQLAESDREEFMKELGIEESALIKMTRMAFEGLGLISFFTVGEDEVKAWPLPRGASAPEAGGAIHSDIAKGFVRAEMMKYDDLISAGSEAKLKELGKFYLKGRDYIVEDGDVLSFRFSV